MANIFSIDNYPPDYHLGISLIFWIIFIAEALIIGVIKFIQTPKEQLINKKEINFGIGVAAFGGGINFLLVQIGVFYPTYFALYLSIGIAIVQFSLIWYVYYWEKNLINLKKIPTFLSIAIFIVTSIIFLSILLKITNFLTEFLQGAYIFLILIQLLFIGSLVILFAKRVIGNLRNRAIIFLFGLVLLGIGGVFDHPPLIFLFPSYITIISAISFIFALILQFYGIDGIGEGIIAYYNQEQICIIHRGKILKGTSIYYCPSCNTTYCLKCYEQVVKREGCWNCGQGFKPIQEKEWKSEEVSIIDPKMEHKSKSPK